MSSNAEKTKILSWEPGLGIQDFIGAQARGKKLTLIVGEHIRKNPQPGSNEPPIPLGGIDAHSPLQQRYMHEIILQKQN